MESSTLICKRCKAPLEYSEENPILKCPHCGCTELILSPEYTNTISKINISVHRNVFALIVNAKDYGSEICLQDQSNADKGKRRGRKKKTV